MTDRLKELCSLRMERQDFLFNSLSSDELKQDEKVKTEKMGAFFDFDLCSMDIFSSGRGGC